MPVLRRGLVAGAVIVFVVFVFVVIRPFAPDPVDDKSVATVWNEGISRLGIRPVFPPVEDFYVGDVLALVLTDSKTIGPEPILGNSVKLGHIDLSALLALQESRRVVFREEAPRAAVPDGAAASVGLSLVGFPGVTVTHARRAKGGLGLGWFGLGASNDGDTTEEISIQNAFTYGVAVPEALQALGGWCGAAATQRFCKDGGYVRGLLRYAGLGQGMERTADGSAYRYPVEISLVTRVYLAKVIEQRTARSDTRGGGGVGTLVTGSGGGTVTAAGKDTGTASERAASLEGDVSASAAPGRQGSTVSLVRSDGSEVALWQTYDRPLVFGFRAVSTTLP